ncbi:alanine--tRNA ligase [Geoglobus acetivorans]|uniref:Alanine--tRNA ligase n=1 Tax=Geoglobus acetivorans TaxID=565033 RepID=A0ABZ3H6Y3_GEOAI|nr:alanine--tRNA ligase [Geoglobus acetivorans]
MSLDKEYLDITYLAENGFVRKKCPKCGKYFWTADEGREICGDPPCGTYTFIDSPVFRKKFSLDEMREYYLSFFEKRGHERIERYPVVARWRDDIYLTIASIADFQPFVTSGVAPPPANPLTISQPCIRTDDLDSVGRTGRHLTLFEMMAHHAFNYPGQEIYWKSETVKYCTELLEELGVRKEDIVYKEEPWAGGGNAGPCLEAIVGGLELATLVFMNLEEHPEGDIEIKGVKYRKMANYIVDTGYGLERFVWASQGTPTVYDAIFGKVVDAIFENSNIPFSREDEKVREIIAESSKLAGVMGSLRGEKLLELRKNIAGKFGISVEELEEIVVPLEKVYALADHTRTILFMLGDALVPSNAGSGYIARLIIRRSLRMADELGLKLDLFDLISLHKKILKDFSFDVPMETIQEILELEERRYRDTVSKGISLVERTIERKKTIEKNDLVEFYDSHGIPPETVVEIAKSKGVNIELPQDFYAELAGRHAKSEKKEKKKLLSKEYPPTEKLYYNSKLFEFDARVIGIEGEYVILDRTAFYPESGGQDSDTGYIEYGGTKIEVTEVVEENGVVLHRVAGKIPEGSEIRGAINQERRLRHMRHHSATHLLLYALQKKLGKHVWQAGAKKEYGKTRLDVTHYKKLTDREIREIELEVNREIMANRDVTWEFMDRIKAEQTYGFRLYQGGVPPGREIRVVRVGDDVQACGGTHVEKTGEIGVFKILRVESIQDGVLRFEFAAGEAALEHIAREESLLRESSSILRVQPEILPKTVQRFFDEWKDQKKEIEKLQERVAELVAEKLALNAESYEDVKIVVENLNERPEQLAKTGIELAKKGYAGILFADYNGAKIVAFSGDDRVDARDLMKIAGRLSKGGGGGRKDLAQGAGERIPDKDEVVAEIITFLRKIL